MKVVVNRCHGGYELSAAALDWLRDRGADLPTGAEEAEEWPYRSFLEPKLRADPLLVECVETLGADASGGFAHLVVVEVPDDVDWRLGEHAGVEWIYEVHRTWGTDIPVP